MKTVALIIGIVLLVIGVAGFVPGLADNGVLFGVMPMDTIRSVLFAITGLAGIAIGLSHKRELPRAAEDGRDMRYWM